VAANDTAARERNDDAGMTTRNDRHDDVMRNDVVAA
jgi:hypothetical protein